MRGRLSAGEPDKKLLVFIGRLAIEKEIERLLPLVKTRRDVRLAIVGDGPDRARLEKLFANTPTVFTGFLHDRELSEAFASADAFVFPSVSETLGLVILESMASGVPVIAAASGPTKEQIRHLDNGILFEAEDPASLMRAVDALEGTTLVDAIRAKGLAEAREQSWDAASQALLEIYDKAIRIARIAK